MRMSAWAKELGISAQVIVSRLARGWTEEEAVTYPGHKYRYLTFRGRTLTLSQWARKKGMSVAALHDRLKAGWNVADALSIPIQNRRQSNAVTNAQG